MIVARLGLGVLALQELIVGGWNQFWPDSFYANFPTVAQTPPFSEHFARDFGGATLGIAVLLVIAIVRPSPLAVLMSSLAYTVFALPHFVFHAEHLEHATLGDALFLIIGNGLFGAVGVLLVVYAVVRMRRERHLRHPAVG